MQNEQTTPNQLPPVDRMEIATRLRKEATQLELEARVEKAVKRYGKELLAGTPMSEAFLIISECLETGASAIEKSKKSWGIISKLTRR